jgi:hypothetical protein
MWLTLLSTREDPGSSSAQRLPVPPDFVCVWSSESSQANSYIVGLPQISHNSFSPRRFKLITKEEYCLLGYNAV